ncbi:hypothetical protein D6B99_08290 [Arachidicoccus soli]|uniref:Uncharacterized protein n=2 Tax=Arachidicoccus soli TaxID=2341117 RepID=A0A386HQR6_9BACT|nr:hypothetical protein D6B99_08290 [Arachidicoccus soli]
MLVWQDLHSGELKKLETTHILLDGGKIYMPSTGTSNSRELRLHPQQIIGLQTYLNGGVRDKLKVENEKLLGINCTDLLGHLLC